MVTNKLYDNDAYLAEFTAQVISCDLTDSGYKIVLDKTAFFPEGGGQSADTGFISNAEVFDVQLENGVVYHFADAPLLPGEMVLCKLNFNERYKKMQIHTGEHIVSGVVHNLFGLDNVGFHLGKSEVTLDFNAVLTREDLDRIESAANDIIYKNVAVNCYYPTPAELEKMQYRSKKEITEAVRIVEIEGYDRCACCAPHVKNTGEVGIIKLLDFEKNKGGIRIHMLCAQDALLEFREKYKNVAEISAMLCARQNETAAAVKNLIEDNKNLGYKITELKRQIIELKAQAIEKSDQPLIVFEDGLSIPDMRAFANAAICKRKSVYIFSENAKGGYNYLCAAEGGLLSLAEDIKNKFGAKGGGSDKMIQGSIDAAKDDILDFLQTDIDK